MNGKVVKLPAEFTGAVIGAIKDSVKKNVDSTNAASVLGALRQLPKDANFSGLVQPGATGGTVEVGYKTPGQTQPYRIQVHVGYNPSGQLVVDTYSVTGPGQLNCKGKIQVSEQ